MLTLLTCPAIQPLATASIGPAAGLVAYIDLGSGSMLLQLTVAGLFSGLYLVKSNLTSLRMYLGRRARKDA